MIILKHVEHAIKDQEELDKLLSHLEQTTSKIEGVELRDIYFPRDREEFILELICENEARYLEWRKICPPPKGSSDWHEVLLTKSEYLSK